LTNDPYVDPDTGVLVNLLGFADPVALERSEAEYAALGMAELDIRPLVGNYDVAHLQAFHRHLFGDVYPWAGDFRTVNIARTALFGDWRHIRTYLDHVFADLRAEQRLAGLSLDAFVPRLAHYLGEVNAAHPFREGNGRTQRSFFRQLAREAGWSLRWSTTTADENTAASEASLRGDHAPLEALLHRAIAPLDR
jgi:cell filamentation protein